MTRPEKRPRGFEMQDVPGAGKTVDEALDYQYGLLGMKRDDVARIAQDSGLQVGKDTTKAQLSKALTKMSLKESLRD